MACGADSDACRDKHIAGPLGLRPHPKRKGDFEGKCPACGHGGFALSKPTLTKMRNMWVCNCKICHGGRGCPARVTRAAMLRQKIPPWCLGSYIGKGKPEADLDRLRKIAQTVDDLIDCCPVLSAADMVMLLADARGDKIPDHDYSECAAFAKKLGMSHGNAYNVAAKWTRGSGSRPSDSQVSPQTGEEVTTPVVPRQRGTVSTPQGQSPATVQKLDEGPSRSWTEVALDGTPASPKVGQRTLDDTSNRRPAA